MSGFRSRSESSRAGGGQHEGNRAGGGQHEGNRHDGRREGKRAGDGQREGKRQGGRPQGRRHEEQRRNNNRGHTRERGRQQHRDLARWVAYTVVRNVNERGAFGNLELNAALRAVGLRGGRDAAFATELTHGTLRHQGQLDAVIDACSSRPLEDIDPEVRAILRLGVYQALHTRVGVHAAVNTSVDLCDEAGCSRAKGLVNAVLRRTTERTLQEWIDELRVGLDPLETLALRTAHPVWIVDGFHDALAAGAGAGGTQRVASAVAGAPLVQEEDAPNTHRSTPAADAPNAHGSTPEEDAPAARTAPTDTPAPEGAFDLDDELLRALEADEARPQVHLVAWPGEISAEELALISGGEETEYSPYGVVLPSGNPADLDPVREGMAAVQDEGSQLIARAVVEAPLEGPDNGRWLDLCAGPGGKAALMGALAAIDGAQVDAVEPVEHRAELVRTACRAFPVTVHIADGRKPGLEPGYDRVLVDAPCSGLGSLRRRPEARWRKSPEDVHDLVILQRELLASAVALARPGAVVVYSTCSPLVEETLDQVAWALENLTVEELATPALMCGMPRCRAGRAAVQMWPHRHGTDAMFLQAFRVK